MIRSRKKSTTAIAVLSLIVLLMNSILRSGAARAETDGKAQAPSGSVAPRDGVVQSTPQGQAQPDKKTFEPIPEFPAEYVHSTMREYKIGKVLVVIGQAKTKEETRERARHGDANAQKVDDLSDDCSAWISVRKDGVEKSRIVYRPIDALGGFYGIFVPKQQPSNNYFMAVKLGDYDGKLLIVDKRGNLTELVGGSFFVTRDGRYLVSEYDSDGSDVAVFDLTTGKVVSQTCLILDSPAQVPDKICWWYLSKSLGYFFTDCYIGDASAGQESGELRDHINAFDAATGTARRQPATEDTFKNAERVKLVWPPVGQPDCECAAE